VTARDVLADVLLGLAVAIVLASTVGLVMMRFVTPIALVAPVIVGLAVLAQSGLTENTAQTWLALVFIVIAGPFLSHATIRAARIREKGDWRPGAGRDRGSPGSPGDLS